MKTKTTKTSKATEAKKVVILYSGGLDSRIMLHLAESMGLDVKLVHYDIGQPYNKKETEAIKKSKRPVEIRKLDWIRTEKDIKSKDGNAAGNIMIPGRNLALATMAASTFLPDEIWMGGLKGEDNKGATDKNYGFIKHTNAVFDYVFKPYERTPKLVFPLLERNFGKFEAVKLAYENGLSEEEILNTSSCLSGEEGNCGRCIVCFRRNFIFKQLGIEEKYNHDPLKSMQNLMMVKEMISDQKAPQNSDVHYDEYRRREIIPGLLKEFNCKFEDLEGIIDDLLEVADAN